MLIGRKENIKMAALFVGTALIIQIAIIALLFLIVVLLLGFIIRVGVQWGIYKSTDHIRGAVREAILSTQPAERELHTIKKE